METPESPTVEPAEPSLRGYAVALLLVTGAFLFTNQALLRGDAFPRWDASKFYAPAFMLVADHAREGQFLLWNPWLNGGRPDGADPQVGAFSPWTVAVGLVTGGELSGYIIYWLATWWLGIVGVLALARRLRVPAWGAVVAASAFFSSGFFTGHAQHMTFLYSQAFLPWIIWRLDVALTRNDRWAAAQTGALWGVSALAGYPGLTILNFGFAGLWTLGRLFFPEGSTPGKLAHRLGRVVGLWVLIVAVGLVVLSPTYASFFVEGKGYSDRVEALTRERAVESNALHPGALQTHASPHLMEIKAANRELWPYSDPSMVNVYVGAAAFVLAFGGLLITPRRLWLWWLLGVGLFFLLSAMGRALPLRGWLYDYVPPLRFFRHSAIFRAQYIFALVVLALYGSRALHQRLSEKKAWAKVGILGLGIAPIAWILLRRMQETEEVTRILRLEQAGYWAAAFWLAPAVAAALACWSPWSTLRRAAPWVLALAALVDGCLAVELSRSVMEVRNRIERGIWADVDAAHVQELDVTHRGLDRAVQSRFGDTASNRSQAAKEAAFQSIDPFNNPYMVFWSGTDEMLAWVTGRDRIWISETAEPMAVSLDAFRAFLALAQEGGEPPLLIHPDDLEPPPLVRGQERAARMRELGSRLAALPAARRIDAEVKRYLPNELTLAVESPVAGWLWVTDRYASGWKVTVDGEPRPLHKANFLFRAVEIPAGRSEVRFLYEFAFFPWLLVASWGTLLGVGVGSVVAGARARQRKRQRAAADGSPEVPS